MPPQLVPSEYCNISERRKREERVDERERERERGGKRG